MENLPTPFPLLDHPELLVPIHIHTEESLDYARNFPIQDGDVFNVTFPKSGTTWMQEILTLVTSNGDLSQVKTRPNWERVPWLEHNTAKEFLEKRAAPRLISTHLPYEYAPAQLSKGRGKVIYTARNPKDITISYYHFSKFVKFLEDPGDFKDFTNKMIHGTVYMCPWFRHIQSWLDHKDQLDLLYVTYEDMILDLRGNVLRIAEFLGYDLNEGALSAIMDHCTFSSMKDSQMVNYTLVPNQLMDHTTGKFMRKGKVGDWKNHFTVAQSEEFDRVYNQKMKGYDVNFIWDI